MDAVNRAVHAASTALWGEDVPKTENVPHGDEPISGVQGKGLANDPYDAGNRDEQPDAPATDGNTIPQEPRLDGKPKYTTELSTDSAAAGGSGSSEALKSTTNTQTEQRSTEEPVTETKSGDRKDENKDENKDESESAQHSKADDPHSHVSTEALKGPQGPPPKTAEQFENEMKEKKPVAKETKEPASENAPSGSSNETPSNDQASGNDKGSGSGSSGSDKGSGKEKHSTMAKMKERLSKVAHPRHGKA